MRAHVRHPLEYPVTFDTGDIDRIYHERLRNVSLGGCSLRTDTAVPVGAEIIVRIPVGTPDYFGRGQIVWSHNNDDGTYDLGVQFNDDPDEPRQNLVVDVCNVMEYKADVLVNEGRWLSAEEAAEEYHTKKDDILKQRESEAKS